jgi:hypothetical protein
MSSYRYRITAEALNSADQHPEARSSFSFETTTHDDLFRIVETRHKKQVVEEDAATALGLGLKLFAEVVIRHQTFR